jgi:deoxyribonuclease V
MSQEASTLETSVFVHGRFSFEKALAAQRKFSHYVRKRSHLPGSICYVAGVDVAYPGKFSLAAATLLDYGTLKPVEVKLVRRFVKVPYRPGFLGFREAPIMVQAIQELDTGPDVILVDGHGLAHPRSFGLACHVGVMLDQPTIGVAKSSFYGKTRGNWVFDKNGNKIAGLLGVNKRKLYVSIGHRVSLTRAIEITRHCIVSNAPEPLRLAHQEATRMARNDMP